MAMESRMDKDADSSLLETDDGVDQAPTSTETKTSTDVPDTTTKYKVYRRHHRRHRRHRRWLPFWHKDAESSLVETDDSVHFMQLPTDL